MELTNEQQNMLDSLLEEVNSEELPNPPEEVVINLIPENSDTALQSDNTSRFSSALWYEECKKHYILLAGCGGIGSFASLLLSRVQVGRLELYDADKVETSNLSGQFFQDYQVGDYKVDAVANNMCSFSDYYNYYSYRENYTMDSPTEDIMICGFDNMEARKIFFNKWLERINHYPEEERKRCLFIDGRCSAETLQVLCITGNDAYNIKRYKDNFLFSSAEADATVCSYKQTTFMTNMIGSIITNLYVNFCANLVEGILIERDLPFFTQYEAETMYFKTEN